MSAEPNVRTLTIDGEEISARSDQTILDAAREHNVKIPTLCHLEGLSEVGACRVCLVEVPFELPSKPVRVNISIEDRLLDAVDRAARTRGQTRSAFLADAAREKIKGAA